MPKRLIFYPYNMGSESCKKVAQQLDATRVRPAGKYKYFQNHLVINWGCSGIPNWWTARVRVINHPNQVALATNKIRTFKTLQEAGVQIPTWFTDVKYVTEFFKNNPKAVIMCRTVLDGHSGRGIVVAQKIEDITAAKLYTVHLRHADEFRVHVCNGKVIDAVQKRKTREGVKDAFIRSHDNGYVFCRENVVVPEDATKQAIAAIKALGLVFGAVDIAYRRKEQKAFVLEVNTAPGLEGQSIQKYVDAFKEIQNAV